MCGGATLYNVSDAGVSPYDLTAASSSSGVPEYKPVTGYSSVPSDPYSQQNPYAPSGSQGSYPPPPPFIPGSQQGQKPPQRSSTGRIILLIGLIVLLIGGSALIYYATVYQPNQTRAQATAMAIVQTTGTAHAQVTGTALTQTHLTATAIAEGENPYPPHQGTLALNDPLKDNSHGNNWAEGSTNSTGTCQFKDGAYHVSESNTQSAQFCASVSSDFSNFAYEVQMTIIQGDGGGIMFRADSVNGKFYYFFLSGDGTYAFLLYTDLTHPKILSENVTSAINRGMNKANLIAAQANGNAITLYINHQQIVSVNDSTYSHGKIGLIANPYITNGHATEIAYSNARVWTL
jgi:hypothetical protein